MQLTPLQVKQLEEEWKVWWDKKDELEAKIGPLNLAFAEKRWAMNIMLHQVQQIRAMPPDERSGYLNPLSSLERGARQKRGELEELKTQIEALQQERSTVNLRLEAIRRDMSA